ncbi:MAG TPA: fructosamine kinase family protein [Steroidobacteraceae bacterium]|nr:fructosamine kinase family protein [Steroidobacteraceae bacterium]
MRSIDAFEVLLEHALHVRITRGSQRAVGGGSIDQTLRVETELGPIFVKRGPPQVAARFEAEAQGLRLLGQAQAVRVPQVLAHSSNDEYALLALEWIELDTNTRSSEATLGEQLAWQHRKIDAHFGLSFDNFIGATSQRNTLCNDWTDFFREYRLRAQLNLAKENRAGAELIDRGSLLCELMDAFFSSYRPVPSLLHGDLWSGNWGTDEDDMPVIFDPAVYCGDREADIAMTKLFGGFGSAFYTAYHSTWPLDQAAGTRMTLYNLYHVINHFNLFGGHYEGQALAMTNRLLAELGR